MDIELLLCGEIMTAHWFELYIFVYSIIICDNNANRINDLILAIPVTLIIMLFENLPSDTWPTFIKYMWDAAVFWIIGINLIVLIKLYR